MTTPLSDLAPKSLRERRQQQTRDELVRAALSVIEAEGITAATIDRMSAASGTSRGTVYAYFPAGRDELLREAYARLGARLVEQTRAAVSEAGDWSNQLLALARAMFALARDEHLGYFYNVTGPALFSSAPAGEEAQELRGTGSGASVEMIRATLELAAGAGEVPGGIESDALALMLVGSLRESAIEVAAGGLDAQRAERAFVRLIQGLSLERD